jgi:putative LysE/RhtB family amino acid efflux pump
MMFTFGVLMGSTAWWLILSSGVGLLRSQAGPHFARLSNVFSGVVLLGFAVYALATLA